MMAHKLAFMLAAWVPTKKRKERLLTTLQNDDHPCEEPKEPTTTQLKDLHAQERANLPPRTHFKRRNAHTAMIPPQYPETPPAEEPWRNEPHASDWRNGNAETGCEEANVNEVHTTVNAELEKFKGEKQDAAHNDAGNDESLDPDNIECTIPIAHGAAKALAIITGRSNANYGRNNKLQEANHSTLQMQMPNLHYTRKALRMQIGS